MSKELEALNKITYAYGYDENIEIVNKSLKAFEIIKQSIVATPDIPILKVGEEKYVEISLAVPVEKYELLKEVLL